MRTQNAATAPTMHTNPENLRDNVRHVKEIADGIVHVSRAIKDLEKGRLSEKAIIVLLAHETKMSQSAIKKVLTGLSQLEEVYLKPKKEQTQ